MTSFIRSFVHVHVLQIDDFIFYVVKLQNKLTEIFIGEKLFSKSVPSKYKL